VTAPSPRIGAVRDERAPRLVEWTGERMLPWTDDPALAYEHLHRYLFAARLAAGRRVLDMGSGEGYGSALLATAADAVVGIDVDRRAVEHARATYPAERLRFEQASADDLSAFEADAFDVVTCFEVIEHVEAQDRVVAEARRVLAGGGLFLCSTPERDAYRARTGEVNPFHVRELDRAEFETLLGASFPHMELWSQVTLTGSLLEPLAADPAPLAGTFHIGRDGEYWDVRDRPEPLYLVALASAEPLPAGGVSVLVDADLELFEGQRTRAERAERELHEARVERGEAEERIQGLRAGLEGREAELRELVATADALREEMLAAGDAAADRERELDERVKELTGRLAVLAAVEQSLPYRTGKAVRRRLRRPDGTPNAVGRAAAAATRLIARLRRRRERR
jgi:SAM-dependent methyltransferase